MNPGQVLAFTVKFSPKEITDVCECYDIEKNVWDVVDVKNKANWIPCDLAMAY